MERGDVCFVTRSPGPTRPRTLLASAKLTEPCKKLGISEQTYSRWRKEYGGLRCDQAKRLKALEHENTRLKRLVADQALDNAILKERGCLGKLLSPPTGPGRSDAAVEPAESVAKAGVLVALPALLGQGLVVGAAALRQSEARDTTA